MPLKKKKVFLLKLKLAKKSGRRSGNVPSRPRKILNRSDSIARREEGLVRTLVVTVISGSHDSILPSIASRFEIEASSMSLMRFGDARFLLILPSTELAKLIYNGGHAFETPTLRLNVMRWTRLINSRVESLHEPVEVDISGFPAHAWEFATAELILRDDCWIGGVHPEASDRRDVYKVVAWSSLPALIPPELNLEILELPLETEEARPAKRTLVYPVKMRITPLSLLAGPADPPSPPPADDSWWRHGRRHPSPSPNAPAQRDAPQVPIHERLGPRAETAGRRGHREAVAALEPSQRDASALSSSLQVTAAVTAPMKFKPWRAPRSSRRPPFRFSRSRRRKHAQHAC